MFLRPLTHAGKFHADEVFASAFLDILGFLFNPMTRSIQPEDIAAADIVLDIGRKYDPETHRYDHHQNDPSLVRANGTPYATFGLIVKHFGHHLLTKEEVEVFEDRFVKLIDGDDTGHRFHTGQAVTISELIDQFNPGWDDDQSPEAFNRGFGKAFTFARDVLMRQIKRVKDYVKGRSIIHQAARDSSFFNGRLVCLPRFAPWKEVITTNYPDVRLLMYPHLRSPYAAEVVPVNCHTYESHIRFPESWRGLEGKELEEAAEEPGAQFCHKTGFLVTGNSKECVLNLAAKTLKHNNLI